MADSKTRTVIPFNQSILLQGKGPRRHRGVAVLSAFPQIKPAKIHLSLIGRLLVHVAVDVGGDLGGDVAAA